jgi:hypothetical protein
MSDSVIVTIRHLRAAGMCSREPRRWFKQQGLNWSDFATEGLPASVLIATADPLALKVVEIAQREAADGE